MFLTKQSLSCQARSSSTRQLFYILREDEIQQRHWGSRRNRSALSAAGERLHRKKNEEAMRLSNCKTMTASAIAVFASMLLASAPLAHGFVASPAGTVIALRQGSVQLVGRRSIGAAASSSRPAALSMAVAGAGDAAKVVVCGPRDGIAGLVASRLSGSGGARQIMLADETETLEQQLVGAKVVVASSDGGPEGEEAPPGLADEIVSALSPSTEYLVWVDTPEGRKTSKRVKAEMGVIGGLFGGNFREASEAVRSVEGDVKCVVIHAGKLFGASGGAEPVPFLTGPKAEPVLDQSITRQAVLLGPGTVLSSPGDATTKRSSVVEAIERLLEGPERRRGVELSVVSVAGFATSDEEWQEELRRLDDSEGVAVFSIDFESIDKREQLLTWLAESWGPAALRKSAAAMLRSGARPVAVAPTPQGLELVWETLTEDLTAVQAGKLSIVVNDEPAGMRVVRVAGPGQPQGKVLSGEEEIVQSLLQGINTVAYPKALVKRKAAKVSLADAAAAMQAASSPVPPAAATVVTPTEAPAATTAAAAGATAEEPSVAAAAAAPAPPPADSTPLRKGRGRRSGGKRKSS